MAGLGSNVPSNMSLLKCSHIWEEGGGEQRVRSAAASTTSLPAQCCSLLLKGFKDLSQQTLPSPVCSSSHWGLQVQGTRRGLSLNTALCTAGKSLGDLSQVPHKALEKRALCCFVPLGSHPAAEKASNASYARVQSKVVLLRLLEFSLWFLMG